MGKRDSSFKGLAHICVWTKDLEKSVRFYIDNLQFDLWKRSELYRPDGLRKFALIRQGTCTIELLQPPQPELVEEKAKGPINHYAIEVKNIEKVVSILKAKGITFDKEVFMVEELFGGIKGAILRGPSNETIELFEYLN